MGRSRSNLIILTLHHPTTFRFIIYSRLTPSGQFTLPLVFVASTPQFTQHPEVANGASNLIAAVFGDTGRHARTAVGVASLPRGAVVEVEAIIELED